MKISIEQCEEFDDVEIIIKCNTLTDELLKLISYAKIMDNKITGIKDKNTFVINYDEIYYFESVDNKTFIYCKKDVYESNLKLYELEELLGKLMFFRCSKSTIINLKKVKILKPLFNSKIEITMDNDEKIIVNRQYVNLLKEKFNIN